MVFTECLPSYRIVFAQCLSVLTSVIYLLPSGHRPPSSVLVSPSVASSGVASVVFQGVFACKASLPSWVFAVVGVNRWALLGEGVRVLRFLALGCELYAAGMITISVVWAVMLLGGVASSAVCLLVGVHLWASHQRG